MYLGPGREFRCSGASRGIGEIGAPRGCRVLGAVRGCLGPSWVVGCQGCIGDWCMGQGPVGYRGIRGHWGACRGVGGVGSCQGV